MSDKELKDMSLNELSNEAAAEALEAFVAEGGKGLRSRIFLAMQTALQWKMSIDEERKNKEEASIPQPPATYEADQVFWCWECKTLTYNKNHRCEQWASVTPIPPEIYQVYRKAREYVESRESKKTN